MARGRKVNSNGERSKQLLLEKAVELFSIHGYHETKISDIVKAANLTQPTFYLYFQSKDKLFNDLNVEFTNNLISIFTEKLEKTKNGQAESLEYIRESIEKVFEYFYENPNLTKIGFYESPSSNQLKDRIAQLFATTLNNERGNIQLSNNVEVETLAHSVIGSIERLTLKYILTKTQTPNQLANDVLAIYFNRELQTLEK